TVVLTGIEGSGKTALALRVAHRLQDAGFRLVWVRAAEGATPAERARRTLAALTDALDRAFTVVGRGDLAALRTSPDRPLQQRLGRAGPGRGGGRPVRVLDQFAAVLAPLPRHIADPELAGFYRHLLQQPARGSRVLVASRRLPADTPPDLP